MKTSHTLILMRQHRCLCLVSARLQSWTRCLDAHPAVLLSHQPAGRLLSAL